MPHPSLHIPRSGVMGVDGARAGADASLAVDGLDPSRRVGE